VRVVPRARRLAELSVRDFPLAPISLPCCHNMSQPKFIVLDGPEGCGKSTQSRLLLDRLTKAGEKGNFRPRPRHHSHRRASRAILLNPATAK